MNTFPTYRLDLIEGNPWQPRQSMDQASIEELAFSIARDGLLQVPIARQNPNPGETGATFQLAIGHRRLEAFKLLANAQAQVEQHQETKQPYDGMAPNKDLIHPVIVALKAGRTFEEIPLDIQELTDQQMFERAIQENLQRKDLNPVEQAAAMKRYMEEFRKNSREAGEFFGVNDATVRGTVRLLELPEMARTALAEGRITVGLSRQVLAAAQVLDEKTMNGALKEIEIGDVAPENVFQSKLSNSNHVVDMWAPYQGDKPRGGRNGWLLDMKNFPNQMLPSLTAGDAAAAIGAAKDAKAISLLRGITFNSPGMIQGSAGYSLLKNYSADLAERLMHLINPPACSACPSYIKFNGHHYCGIRHCFQRKAEAFKAQKLADMSRSLKIEIYQDGDGTYLPLDSSAASHIKAFEKRIADLRLLPNDKYKNYLYQRFQGQDQEIAYVVAIGESTSKLAITGSHTKGGKKSEKEKAEMRAMKSYRQRRKQILWEYTEVAQSIFANVPSDAMKYLKHWHYVINENKIPDEYKILLSGNAEEKLEYQRRELVWAMIDEATSFYHRTSLVRALKKCEEITTVPAPEDIVGVAERWDDEINALGTVSAETEAA